MDNFDVQLFCLYWGVGMPCYLTKISEENAIEKFGEAMLFSSINCAKIIAADFEEKVNTLQFSNGNGLEPSLLIQITKL